MKKTQTSEIRARKAIVHINSFKESVKEFTKDDLEDFLRSQRAPYWNRMLAILNKSGQIEKIDTGLYKFSNVEPVCYKSIVQEMDRVIDSASKSCSKWRSSKTLKVGQPKNTKSSVDEAIALLKNLGYRILKPRTEFDEV